MSKEHILGIEGIQKLKEIAEGIDVCMFCTDLSARPAEVTPMSVQEVDDTGAIWFLASKSSDKFKNISKDSNVHLLFADNSNYRYLTVYGEAELSEDQSRIDKYWNIMVEGWFEKGREDPDIVLIKVAPTAIYYWDTKDHKMIAFAKVLWSAVTGNKADTGVQGSIDI